jgi:hypothetical protein
MNESRRCLHCCGSGKVPLGGMIGVTNCHHCDGSGKVYVQDENQDIPKIKIKKKKKKPIFEGDLVQFKESNLEV